MKKLFTLLALIVTLTIFAQAPQGFNYQATVRNSSGVLITNQNVYFKFNIMSNSQTSVPIYTETHYVPTDDLGQVNLVIGTGTAIIGAFSTINWGTGSYFLGIELKVSPSTTYVPMGTTQLLSVPYALYANSAGSTHNQGKPSILISGNITNAEAASQIANEIGINTENIFIQNTTGLTSLDLSTLTSIVKMKITDNANLTSINLNGLKKNFGEINIASNSLLSSLSLPAFTVALDSLRIEKNAALTAINMPLYSKGNISVSSNSALTSLNLPVFDSGIIRLFNNPTISSLNLPGFSSGTIHVFNNSTLASINLPLFYSGKIRITYNSLLSYIGIPNFTVSEPYEQSSYFSNSIYYNNYIRFMGNALPSSVVNTLIHQMLSVTPLDGKQIDLSGQNPPAPPTGQGIIDKQTLTNALNSVYTDGFVPTVTTTAVTAVTNSTAISGGNITNSGGSIITAKGVVWSTSNDPTTENNIGMTTDGSGEGMFTSNLVGLTPGTTYYVRAYATSNEYGTGYGQVETFTTPILPNRTIGSQIWTSSNMDLTIYRDGTPIPQITDQTAWANLTTGAWCYYNNDPANGAIYGKLYNWYAVAGIYDAASLNDPSLRKQFAPSGWHVPSDLEWSTLINYIDPNANGGTTVNGTNILNVAGGKMKETGISHWLTPNTAATNSSGFSGLPGGVRNTSIFNLIGATGGWWSSSEYLTNGGWYRYLNYNNGSIYRAGDNNGKAGSSVRCVKD
ncbi:Fibrobacter succinogenes major paralogous domain [Flavobacteriaceae bacterium]